MKQRIKKYFFPAVLLFILGSCSKSELTTYDQPDMVYIYKDFFATNNDSTVYSFAIKPAALVKDTIKIPVRIMGLAKNVDRVVNVALVADSTNAVAGQHFDLLPTVIKAGEYKSFIPVLVKRAADLQLAEVKLMLEIKESADFKTGIPATAPVNPRAGGNLRYKIRLNDILTKPSNWDTRLATFFGVYSKVKYLYIINITGVTEFNYAVSGGPAYSEMIYYNILLKTAMANYVAANGPLLDENGVAVTFP